MNSDTTPSERAADPRFEIRQCTNPSCGLRFSIEADFHQKGFRPERCPVCRAPTQVIEANIERATVGPAVGRVTGPAMEVVLDNIRSAWNVGSMLRAADGAGVRQAHLCGVTSTPENPKVAKTALGAERSLPWQFHPNGVALVESMIERGMRVWALEGGSRAESLFDLGGALAAGPSAGHPLALVVGNELSGVDPGILQRCERVVCLPMMGVKGSLNVAVAFGIAVYYIRFGGIKNANS